MNSPLHFENLFEETWFYAALNNISDRFILSDEESHHLTKVLRVQPDQCVIATNGMGSAFICEFVSIQKNIELIAKEILIPKIDQPKLSLVIGLLKGRDLEEPVAALCQLPLKSIQIVITDHTQEFKGQDHHKLVERLKAKSLVALKQSKKTWLTEIHEPTAIKTWRDRNPDVTLVLVHPGLDEVGIKPEGEIAVLTGPEGGFSESEVKWLEEVGCRKMNLGATRIRGTVAPVLACGKLMGLGWL